MENGEELFGPGNTWFSVFLYCMRVLSDRYRWMQQTNLDDAAMSAVEWGMTRWVKAPSSVVPGNPDLTFRGAKWACSHTAMTLLKKQLEPTPQYEVPDASDPLVVKATAVVNALEANEAEWASWARDFLDGVTERDVAKEEGVSQQSINRRRQRGMKRIRPLLKEFGLINPGGTA
ncbi:MAG: hypothetical protein ACXVGB_00120 [Mycobacteriaceae bacterium]